MLSWRICVSRRDRQGDSRASTGKDLRLSSPLGTIMLVFPHLSVLFKLLHSQGLPIGLVHIGGLLTFLTRFELCFLGCQPLSKDA